MSVLDNVRRRFDALGMCCVEVPEWPDETGAPTRLYFTPFTPKERDRLYARDRGDAERAVDFIVMKACDEQGKAVFSLADKPQLLRMAEANVLARIVEEAVGYVPAEDDPGN